MAAVLPQGGVVVFPPEPPVAAMNPVERPAVKGAPGLGAAERTLDGEDRSATPQQSTGGCGGKTTFPAGELRVYGYAAVSTSVVGAG